jgi:hypothetical protein
VVHVNGQTIGLSIVETAQETVMRYIGNGTYVPDASYVPPRTRSNPYPTWTTTKEKPSGRLRLVAYAPHYGVNLVRQWQAFGKTCFTKPANEIISSIEAMAVEMVPLVAAAEQQRETERRQREEQWHRYRKEEDRRRIEESIKESSEELNEIIRCWAETKARSEFLTGLEVELSKLGATERSELEGRVALARELLGSIEPLSRFKRWRAPSERYVPAKFEEEDGLITQS